MRIIKATNILLAKKDFKIFALCEFTIIMFLVILIYLKDNAYKNIYSIDKLINNLDWKIRPISEIEIIDKNSNKSCQISFENFINYRGDTIIDNIYCVCPDFSNINKTLSKNQRYCYTYEKSKGCYDSYSNLPDFKVLKGKIVCFKRSQENLNYYNLQKFIFSKEKGCPGYLPKNCGKVDSKENVLCLMMNQSCPINSVVFDDKKNFGEKDLIQLKNLTIDNKIYENNHNNKLKNFDTKVIEFDNGNIFVLISNSSLNDDFPNMFENAEFIEKIKDKRIITYLKLEKDFPCSIL